MGFLDRFPAADATFEPGADLPEREVRLVALQAPAQRGDELPVSKEDA